MAGSILAVIMFKLIKALEYTTVNGENSKEADLEARQVAREDSVQSGSTRVASPDDLEAQRAAAKEQDMPNAKAQPGLGGLAGAGKPKGRILGGL